MSRIVRPPTYRFLKSVSDEETTAMGPMSSPRKEKEVVDKGDKGLEKIVNFIPAEVLVFYGAVVGALNSYAPPPDWRNSAAVTCFGIAAALTLIYTIIRSPQKDLSAWFIACFSVLAFAVWAYSMGGIFAFKQLYHPVMSGLFVSVFTLLSGLIPIPARKID